MLPINGVVIHYTDVMGAPRIVGPPGYERADDVDVALLVERPEHPMTLRGLRYWADVKLSFPATLAGATQIGAAYLAEHSRTTSCLCCGAPLD